MLNFLKKLIIIIVTILAFALIFTGTTNHTDWNGIEYNDHNFLNMLYFITTTHSSAGYGDITPATNKSKIMSIITHIIMMSELMTLITL